MNGSDDLLSPAEVDLLRESIRDAVLGAPAGMSTALQDDVSRQAAQQRFASPVSTLDYVQTMGNEPARKVLSPLTAFDEMAVLEQQGRLGWHVVDYGTLHHVVEACPWQWEHRRVVASVGARRHHLDDEGWLLIKTMWFPWAYYKRCLNVPAEPDTTSSYPLGASRHTAPAGCEQRRV